MHHSCKVSTEIWKQIVKLFRIMCVLDYRPHCKSIETLDWLAYIVITELWHR
jgi:hypothetical protein